jgi:hypothetical protein
VNGGAWLTIGGQRVDFIYRNLDHIERVIVKAEAGGYELDYAQQPPFGFFSGTYLGEIAVCISLFDPEARIDMLNGGSRSTRSPATRRGAGLSVGGGIRTRGLRPQIRGSCRHVWDRRLPDSRREPVGARPVRLEPQISEEIDFSPPRRYLSKKKRLAFREIDGPECQNTQRAQIWPSLCRSSTR